MTRHATDVLNIGKLSVRLPDGADRPFAVHDMDLTIEKGEILCIVGESGSGKSMTANAVMGLLPKSLRFGAEHIRLNDRNLLRQSRSTLRDLRGREVAMIFQEPLSALNPLMRIGDQIAEVMKVHPGSDFTDIRARVLQLLAFVGLPEPETIRSSYPFRLSGGQRQRVMIAMALALEPDLLIADEPTTALDVTTQAQILDLMKRIRDEKGMGIMMITHDIGVVAELADRVIVMRHGETLEDGPVAEVLEAPKHAYTRQLIDAVPMMIPKDARPFDTPPLLSVKNLNKIYGKPGGKHRAVHAVNDVSFDLRAGETLSVVGESGSGKSTVAKLLVKLEEPNSGQYLLDGEDVTHLSVRAFRPKRRVIQMIFQDPYSSLNPQHTVARSITAGPLAAGVSRALAMQDARRLISRVGLDESALTRFPHEFSGGQRQRIGIARALAMSPRVLVADESVSALDVSVQAKVLDLLADLQREYDLGLIFITHDLRVACQISDNLVVMHRGRIVERGSAHDVLLQPQDHYTQALVAALPGQAWEARRETAILAEQRS
ncbi:dipeptide ABC transporter ATP-binding protein [Salipiger abyssi]|uniref:dipeptide ABC transporter ATP-binding protein n=1 Tax=Salipiger abyssi TaxID=1250539 RepID=UPI0040582D0A